MENYERLLMTLQQEIIQSKKSIIGGGRAIDERRCMEIINALRDNMPKELVEARYILNSRDDIIRLAKEQGDDIIASAKQQSAKMVYESEIVQRASSDADNIRRDAVEYANYLERETRKSLNDIFIDAENKLGHILSAIRDSRESLFNEPISGGGRNNNPNR